MCEKFRTFVSMKEHIDIDRMVMESHYMESLERGSSSSLSDMERQGYENRLQAQQDYIESLKDIIATLKQTLESVRASNLRNEKLIQNLTSEIATLRKTIADLTDRDRRHNRNTYGKKSRKSGGHTHEDADRTKEKDDYDGSHTDTPSEQKTDEPVAEDWLDMSKVKSEHLDGERGPRGPYSKMDAARVTTLLCDISNLPEGMKFVCFKEVDEYDKISYVECVSYQVAVLEDEYGVRHEYFCAKDKEKAAGRRPHLNVIPGTHGTPEFVADLAVDCHQLLVPNYREGIRMKTDKFRSCDNTRRNWLKKGAELLKPLLGFIKIRLLKPGSFVNIDETWERVRIKLRGDGTKLGHYFKKYIWVLINKKEHMAYFLYDNDENDSRGRRPIEKFLGDFKGAIMSDAFIVYKQLTRDNPDLLHCLCWAHVLCNFDDAAEISKESDAIQFRNWISYLYMVENENILRGRTPEEIKQRRSQKDVTDTLVKLHTHAERLLRTKEDKYSALMVKALKYMLNGWDELLNYRKDGHYTIDNLPAERAIRPVTVARKNSLHYSSEEGLEVALTYMTVIETAKMWGMNAKDFLVRAWREAINGNNDMESLFQTVPVR